MFRGVGEDPLIFSSGVTPRKASVINVLHAAPVPTKAPVLHEATPLPVIPPLLDTGPASMPPPAPNYMPYYIAGAVVLGGGLLFFMTRKH